MSFYTYILAACVMCAIIMAGCTDISSKPITVVPTTQPVITPVPTESPLVDQGLLGTWYLMGMTGPGGFSSIQTISVQMDAEFSEKGGLSGFAGCNHFSADYTLTGEVLPDGKGIMVGPVLSTLMYCAETSDMESTYFEILQDASSYEVSANQLTITSRLGSTLVYHRTPYGPTAVPKGL